jgi:hypothetical protein
MRAVGYHGTSAEAARRILSTGFEISRNEYDWLGDGAYFFQDAPARALEWARQRFGDDAAVIGAEIDLDGCIDLLDPRWHAVIRESYADLVARLQASGLPIPRQTSGAHRLDREVVNRAASALQSWSRGVGRALCLHRRRAAVSRLGTVESGARSNRGARFCRDRSRLASRLKARRR